MPLIVDAAAEISPPMLTCVHVNDGYQFELLIRVTMDEEPLTKVQIGPYLFRSDYVPRRRLGGLLSTGGPENELFMHKSAPPRWSRIHWEVMKDEVDSPIYLTWTGGLDPGSVGVFRFISLFPPGGLRAGLVLTHGDTELNYGVNGPNYEQFERGEHH